MCLHTRSTWKPACLLFTIPEFPSTRAETRTGVFLSPAYSQEVLVSISQPRLPENKPGTNILPYAFPHGLTEIPE